MEEFKDDKASREFLDRVRSDIRVWKDAKRERDVIDLQKGLIACLETQHQIMERVLILELALKKHMQSTEAHKI